MTALFGGSMAAYGETKTADFNGGLPDGWFMVGDLQNADDRARSGKGIFSWSYSDTDNYLVTTAVEGTFEFYARAYNKNKASQVIVYEYTSEGLGQQLFTTGSLRTSSTPQWSKYTFTLTQATQLAIALNYAAIDDVTYTETTTGGGSGDTPDPNPNPDPEPDPAPVMTVSTTTVKFGRVTANATQDIVIGNTGNAELVVTIASDNEEFTVSKSEATVAAGTEETVTITYLYNAEAYGAHTATITLTPNAGEIAQIGASAYVKDPTVWSEDFSANVLPDGWKADNNWTFSDGVAHAQYVYGTADYLTTPTLVVADGESLTFQYKATKNNVKVKIQLSQNGGAFTDYKSTDWLDTMSEFATFTIDGLEAGSYQFRFQNDDYDLDEFEGFRLNQEAPEINFEAEDFVAGKVTENTSKTYTVSNSGTGTLTVLVASDNELFTVSSASLTITDQPQQFTVTFNVPEGVYGKFDANIIVTPTYDESKAVTFKASAQVVDPNLWTEDFAEGVLPEGWTTTGWTIGTSTAFDNTTPMALAPQSTTAASLITPRLQAKAGDVLTWDAYLRWNDEPLLVEYTLDNKTWTTICDYKAADEGQDDKFHKEMSFTAPADGTYRLRFSAKFQNGVDNFSGFALAPSTAVKETWHISYTFHYMNNNNEEETLTDTEDIEVEFDDDAVAFNFPNPFSGNAWLRGTKLDYDGPTAYVFPMGQYVGQYGGETIYYCGGANDTLIDMMFFYDVDQQAFLSFEHILLNGSTTAISLWAYFSDVIIYKDQLPVITGIDATLVNSEKKIVNSGVYDLQGRKVTSVQKPGLYIINGRKVLIK